MRKYFILLIIIGVTTVSLWYFFIYEKQSSAKDWVLYKNENQGFEIKIPSNWEGNIALDNIEEDQHSFRGTFGPDNLYLMIEVNLPGEVTPVLPTSANMCHIRATTTIINASVPIDIFSSTSLGDENSSCGISESLLDKHTVNTQFCVNSAGGAYPATFKRGVGEYFFACKAHNDDIYDIGLACEGAEWSGINGQKACSQLFDKLISTFKTSKS